MCRLYCCRQTYQTCILVKELPSAALWLTSDPDPQPNPIWVTTELIEVGLAGPDVEFDPD